MIEPSTNPTARTEAELRALMARAVHEVRETNPLAPSITNTVTQNFVANAQLAVGGSAAMVYLPDEGETLVAAGGAVCLNMGTLFPIYEQTIPRAAAAAQAAGADLSVLTWGHYFLGNMLPVTLGNTAGGGLVGLAAWYCYLRKKG